MPTIRELRLLAIRGGNSQCNIVGGAHMSINMVSKKNSLREDIKPKTDKPLREVLPQREDKPIREEDEEDKKKKDEEDKEKSPK